MLSEILSKIGFEWHLAITHLINFLLIFFLIVRYGLPAVQKTILERTKKIKEGLEMRENANQILEMAKTDSKNIVQNANQERKNILEKGEMEGRNIVADFSSKAQNILEDANKISQSAKEDGYKEGGEILVKNLPSLLTAISTKAFSGKVTSEVNNNFLENILAYEK